jgi:hypothetical protein
MTSQREKPTIAFIMMLLGLLGSLIMPNGCATRHPTAGHDTVDALEKHYSQQGVAEKAPNRTKDLVNEIPKAATQRDIETKLDAIVAEIGRARRQDMQLVHEALVVLRGQPNAVSALISRFNSLPQERFHERMLTIQIIGELQRPGALDFLRSIVRKPLPPAVPSREPGLFTLRGNEEIIMAKAVQGIAYMRDTSGEQDEAAVKEIISIIQTHPSRAVRVAAIDAYMWNHGDTTEAAATLYKLIPQEFHPYVEMPRFYRGMNRHVFNTRLKMWRDKWAQQKEKEQNPAPERSISHGQ